MAGVEEDEVTSSEPAEELWNIAITSKEDSSNVPSKSSNEILTELFGAFNAEPPESLIVSQDESGNETAKKHKKKHKKDKKHKKKSKSKRRISGEQNDYSSDSENEHEKRKERKHKSKKKHRRKSSDMDSGDEHKPKKRSRRSKSPPVIVKKEPISDSEKNSTSEIVKEPMLEIKKETELNGHADLETSEVTSTSATCPSPPSLSALRKEVEENKSGFESLKSGEAGDDKTGECGNVVENQVSMWKFSVIQGYGLNSIKSPYIFPSVFHTIYLCAKSYLASCFILLIQLFRPISSLTNFAKHQCIIFDSID